MSETKIDLMPLILLVVASPVVLVILSVFGVITFAVFISKIVDLLVIILSIILSAVILYRSKLITTVSVVLLSVVATLIYFAIQSIIASFNPICQIPIIGLLCSVTITFFNLITFIPTLLAFIFWMSLINIVVKKVL